MNRPNVVIDDLKNGKYDLYLSKMYCCNGEGLEKYRIRFIDAIKSFCDVFGNDREIYLFSAPGRTELGGNHTDHQLGCVLAAAINLDVIAIAAKRDDNVICVQSEGFPIDTIDLSDLEPSLSEINKSAGIIRGVSARFVQLGYNIKGFDAYTTSNVLKGSGMSSSAAFEVVLGNICNELYANGELDAIKIAEIGQYAENVFFGKPCGLMDQMASSVGNIVSIDFADKTMPIVERVDFDFVNSGYKLCIIDSGADHADLTDEYSAICDEMKSIASLFDEDVLSRVKYDDFISAIPRVRAACGDRALLRAMHYFNETIRAVDEANMLKDNNFDGFLKYIKESGYSSYMYLQNVYSMKSSHKQEVAVSLALVEQLLGRRGGFRVHGGGFAGTIQAFVPDDMINDFKIDVEKVLGENSCHILSIRQIGGTMIRKDA